MKAIFWIIAIISSVFIPFFSIYSVRRWKQRRFNRKWGLPDEPAEDTDSAEILGKTGVQVGLGEMCQKH